MFLMVALMGCWPSARADGASPAAAPAAAELTALVNEFLAGASRNDVAIHDRFWADDLIYTGSSGRRIGKADILRDLRAAPPPAPEEPRTVFTAEEVRVQQYGSTAIVAFRLVATTTTGEGSRVARYLNTGTFARRGGRWQAVAWQATRMPMDADAARAAASSAAAAIHRAMLAADTTALASSLDDGFVWTDADGRTVTRRELLDRLGSGALRYASLEPRDATVDVHGETAVARGAITARRSAAPGASAPAGAGAAGGHYTIAFVAAGGEWTAVAMHSGP
jgi:ketosteroid isomerase-like protein